MLASVATVCNQMRVNTPRPSLTTSAHKQPRIVSINVNKQTRLVRVPVAQTILAVRRIRHESTLPQYPPWQPPPLLLEAGPALQTLPLPIHSLALEDRPPGQARVLLLPVSSPWRSVLVANTASSLSWVALWVGSCSCFDSQTY